MRIQLRFSLEDPQLVARHPKFGDPAGGFLHRNVVLGVPRSIWILVSRFALVWILPLFTPKTTFVGKIGGSDSSHYTRPSIRRSVWPRGIFGVFCPFLELGNVGPGETPTWLFPQKKRGGKSKKKSTIEKNFPKSQANHAKPPPA